MSQKKAFQATFMQYHGQIHSHLLRLLGSKEEADDIAQAVFMRLHEHYEQVEPEKTKAWLYKVATHLGLNALRSKKRFRNWQEKAKHQPVETHVMQRPPEDILLEQNEKELVRATLERLPERDATLLFLFFAGLRNYRELAEEINVKPGSVGTLLARAKKAFKKEYTALAKAPIRRTS